MAAPPQQIRLLKEAQAGKVIWQLRRRGWTTHALAGLAAAGLITHGILLLVEGQKVRKGVGTVYQRAGQMRLQVVYEHSPQNTYDAVCRDQNQKVGAVVTVWAFGTEPWVVRSLGPDPRFAEGLTAPIVTPIVTIVLGVVLLVWYFLTKKF
jgi:hypothetical protein